MHLLLLHVRTVAVAAAIDFSVCFVVAGTEDTAAVVVVVAVVVTAVVSVVVTVAVAVVVLILYCHDGPWPIRHNE